MKKYFSILCGLLCIQSAWAFDATAFPTLAGLSRTLFNENYSRDDDECGKNTAYLQQPNAEVTSNDKQHLEFSVQGYELSLYGLNQKMSQEEQERQHTVCMSNSSKMWANQWNVMEFRYNFATDDLDEITTYIYKLAGDTTIATNIYSKIMYYPSLEPQKQKYVCAMRTTEDGKTYVYYDNAEYLLYDFEVNIGDVLYTFGGTNAFEYSLMNKDSVVNISTLANGRKKIEVERLDGECAFSQVWIEGVGANTGIIFPGSCTAGSFGYALLCAYHDNECLYSTDNSEFSKYGCEYNQIETAIRNARVSLHSATKRVDDGHILIDHNGKIYNILGMEM